MRLLFKRLNDKLYVPVLLAGLIFSLPYERIPSYDLSIFGTGITLRLSLIIGLVLILVAFIRMPREVRKMSDPSFLLLAAFMFIYLLAALLSSDLKRAVFVWGFTGFTASVAVVVSFFWREGRPNWIDAALYVTTWVVVLFGFYQYFGDLFNLPTSLTGLRSAYTKEIFGFPRIQSVGLEPLYYANFLLIPFFYYSAKFLNGDDERPYLIAVLASQIALTVSRGALISFAAGIMTLLIFMARKIRYTQTLGLLGLVILGVFLALNFSGLRFETDVQGAAGSSASGNSKVVAVVDQATNLTPQDDRVRNRSLAIDAFKAYPLLGVGPGNFSSFAKLNYPPYRSFPNYIIVNNEPAELLAESGIIGFALFTAFALLLLWRLTKLSWQEGSSEAGIWPAALLAYFVALAIQYQTFSTLYIMHVWVAIGIALALTTPSLQAAVVGGQDAGVEAKSAVRAATETIAGKAHKSSKHKKRSRKRRKQ